MYKSYKFPIVELSEAQNHRCAYCRLLMEINIPESICAMNSATREHVQIRSAGGTNDWNNLVAACHFCNSLRNDSNPYWFTDFINKLLSRKPLKQRWHALELHERRYIHKLKIRSYRIWKYKQEQAYNKTQR